MRIKTALLIAAAVSLSHADSYNSLLRRYEAQIKQQERHLRSLRKNLTEKEQDARRWQEKAESAKDKWTDAGAAVQRARQMVKTHQDRRTKARNLAEAAQWSVLEQTSLQQAARSQLTFWSSELYKQQHTPRYFSGATPTSAAPGAVVDNLTAFSQTTNVLAEKAQEHEAALRMDEMRWQDEEQKQALALDRYRHQQQSLWLNWQEAVQRRKSLEEERVQLEQSAQALRVILAELREHRAQTAAVRSESPRISAALNSLKGMLPWPAVGTVTQNFGKQYSEKLQQLVVSNGIKVEANVGKPVRAIQSGKVLFARPFQQYGNLVIIQHQHGLTSVYGELGQTQVKEGDILAALDPIGTVADSQAFYFELRHDEKPINPLVWLTPQRGSEISSRRKFQ